MVSEQITIHRCPEFTLRMLIERHKRIILFSDNFERILSFFALMQVFWDTLIICCLGFVIVIVSRAENKR